jgi:hypothetical protein
MRDQARDFGPKASLLKVIVDQFLSRPCHPLGDIKEFEHLVRGLLESIDSHMANQILQPLILHPDAPESLFKKIFLFDEAELSKNKKISRRLTQVDPAYMPNRPMSQFNDIDNNLLREYASDLNFHFCPSFVNVFIETARDDIFLARILLERNDPEIEPKALFLAASRLERLGIIRELSIKTKTDQKERRCEVKSSFVQEVSCLARLHDVDGLAAIFSQSIACRPDRLRAIIVDRSGQSFGVLLIAIGFDDFIAFQIILSLHKTSYLNEIEIKRLQFFLITLTLPIAEEILIAMLGVPDRHQFFICPTHQ